MDDSSANPFDQFVPKADSNPFTQFTRPMPSAAPAPPVQRPGLLDTKGPGVLSTLNDLSRSAEGAAVTGTGQTIGGIGGLLTRGAGAIDSALGTHITPDKPIWSGPAKTVENYGQSLSDDVSPEFKAATSKGLTDEGGLTVTNVANKALNTVAGLAPQIVGTTAAGLVNPAAGVATGAALFGGQGGQASQEEEQNRIANMSDADLASVPRYKELLDSGLSASDAKAKLSDEAGSHAFNVGAGTGAALGVVPLGKATEALASPLTKAATALFRRPGLGSVVGRGAAEAATFGGINAAGQVVQNETNALPTDATEGVGEAAASGLLPGFVMGAGHQLLHRPGSAPAADANATPGNTTATPDAFGATPDASAATPAAAAAPAPDAGPISRAASMVSPEDTATVQARQQPDAPIENAEADAGAPLTSQEPPAQPPDVPWIDASTGEIRRPTDAEVKDEFHDMFDNAIAANGGAGAAQTTRASPALAQEWGVPLDRLKALRTEAIVERRSGFRPGDKRPSDFNEPGATDGNEQTQTGSEESRGTQAADAGNAGNGATTDAAAGDAANAAAATADGTGNESAAGADAHGSPAEEVAQSQASDRTPLEQFSDRAAQIDDLNAKRKAGELTGAENEQLHDLRDQQDLVNPKSGIPNRKAFDQAMSTGDYSHAVAMDVDGFKRINDTLGHGVGDLVLQHLGQRLAKESNGDILFTHNSGDEYAAAAKGDPTEHLQKLQDDLAKTPIVLKYVDGDGKQVEHTLSGLGLTFGVGKDLHEADIAANTSKERRADAGLRTRREDSRSNVAGGLQDAEGREAAVSGDRRQERVQRNAGDAGSASDDGVTTDVGSGAATATAGNRKAGSKNADRVGTDDGGGEAGIAPNPGADLGNAAGTVRKGREPAKAPTPRADHSGDVAKPLDVKSIAALHDKNHEAAFPGGSPEVKRHMVERVAHAIADVRPQDLIDMNIGDPKNPAVRQTFEQSTGVKLPKGRQATENRVEKWGDDHYDAAKEKEVADAARESAAHPDAEKPATAAQQEAGNHKMGHVDIHGLDVTIEVPKGGMRRGIDKDFKEWERPVSDHYGYIKRTEGADGEQVDVYLGPHAHDPDSKVFVIEQNKPGTNRFDEHKAMIGYATGRDARKSYEANFPKDFKTFRNIREMSMDQFKQWVKDGGAKNPFANPLKSKDDVRRMANGDPSKPATQAAVRLLDNERARQAGTARDLPPPGEANVDKSAEHHEEISSAVSDAVKNFGDNAPNVRVIDSPEKLPAIAKRIAGYEKARGYYDNNGNAYLVSSNIKDVAGALRSLAHEVVGHHGIENILDEHVAGGWDRLTNDIDALRSNPKVDPAIADVLRSVEQRYPDVSKTQFAKETIAVMAERGMRNGIIGRVIAAVKAFVRKFNPDLKYSDADLRSLLTKSDDFLNKNESYADRVSSMEAGAFDQPDRAGLDDKELTDRAAIAEAAKQWQEKGTGSPYFQKWFGDSKVVDKAGDPDVVYHGTGADFGVFDSKRAGASGEHATAPLGHFFTEDRKLADRYAERASDGVPADKRIVDAYLSLKKPYELKLADAQKIESPAEATALRERLEKQGYDGIRIPEAKSWIAFDSEQIKSASENRGTFDAKNKDISFDRAQPDDDGPHEEFSRPQSSVDSLSKVLAEPDGTVLQHVKDWIGGKIDDLKPKLLGALQLRHVLEMMEGYKPLKGAGEYKELEQTMTSDRMKLMIGDPDAAKEDPKNMIAKGPANIASEMRNYAYEKGPAGWFGRQRPEAKALYDLMHSATRFGLDPAEGYSRLQMEDSKGGFSEWSKEGVAERIKELRGQMRGRPGDDKSLMMDEVKRLRNLPKREELRKERWPELVAKWQALPEEGKELYRNVRDWYRQNSDEVEKALLQRIDAMDVPETYKRSIADRIRFQFESNRREGVYFPLQRHGDYWMSLKDSKGENAFLMFEGSKEYAAAEKKLRAGGYTIEAHGRKDSNYKAKDAPSGTFVSDVIKMLQKSGAPEKVQDDIYQSYLKTLPELSMRKHSIHRQNIAGFSEDALRVFAKNSFHSAHQLARLRYGYRMQGVVDAMQMSLDNYRAPSDLETRNQTDPKVVARADTLLAELKRRHDWIMAPKDSNLANVANSIGFMYYLGASPSSALVFLTQNAQMTLPALGAKHGWAKAAPALMSAMKDAIRTGGNIDRTLTSDEERQAYNVFKQRGDITRTQAHALAGLSEGNKLQSTPAWAAVMNGMSFFMHKADMINRGAAGMAAFRLARKAGEDFDSAVSYASDIINGTHGDYSNANRARFMQGSAGKVLFQFKSYALMMAWNTYRNLYQSFKAETPEARKLARKTFTGMMGMAGLLSGAMGLPFYGLARSVGNAYHSAMGDQNEPWDFDTEFKNWLSEHLGSTAGSIVAHGAADKLGADVSSRVGLSDEWFREPDKELEGQDAYYNLLESLAGPMGGMAKNWYVGNKMIEDGNTERGIETMVPKPVRDIMKSYRYSTQGANTVRGDPIVQDVTTPETLIQALGFAPTRIAEQQAENRALQNYSQQIQNKRQQLVNGFAIALRTGDEDLRSNVIQRMQAFNATNPEIAISAANLRSNWLSRQKASAETVNGVHLNKKVNEAVRTAVGAQQ